MNTIENNKSIADFMGFELVNGKYELPQFGYIKTDGLWSDIFYPETLKFNKDWNWLMAVVDKIEKIVWADLNDTSFNVTIGATLYCVIQDNNGGVVEIIGEGQTKIESVYLAVIEFINWYNQQNHK